jgi:hypothetical protein
VCQTVAKFADENQEKLVQNTMRRAELVAEWVKNNAEEVA